MDLKDFSPSQLKRMSIQPTRGKRDAEIAPKASKYKNVHVEIDGYKFQSKRESGEYLKLKARLHAGEISDLRLQVVFPLYAPLLAAGSDATIEVSRYIADFTYYDKRDERLHVVDAKGKRTALYALKAKWLNLQSGITIDEV